MRIGSKGRYAVTALLDVVVHSGPGPVPLADVAERQKISLSYLEQLFAMLRRSGLVVSARGPGGGYRLRRPAEDTSIGEIFRAVEEAGQNGEREWPGSNGSTVGLWSALDEHIRDFLEDVTLADVLAGRFEEPLGPPATSVNPSLSAEAKLA